LAAAIVGFVVTFPVFWQQSASAEPSGAPVPAFVVHARGIAGEPVPLGLRIEPAVDDAAVIVTGLVPGMTLSIGAALGPSMWQVPATELAYTSIAPPKDFVGLVDLIAELRLADATVIHRQPIQIEWIAESPAVAARVSAVTATPEAVPASQQIERKGAKAHEKRVASKVTAPPSGKSPAKTSRSEPVKKATDLIGHSMDVAALPGNKVPQEVSNEPSPEHERQNQCDYQGCASAYRSFRASDCTYQPHGGRRRLCEKTARPTEVRTSQVPTQTRAQQCNFDVCTRFYRSFDPSDCTYQPHSGGARRTCDRKILSGGKMEPTSAQLNDKGNPVLEKAKAAIAVIMESPASAKFGEMKRAVKSLLGEPLDTICGYVKGRDPSGGDTGEMPFLYIIHHDEAYLVDGSSPVAETLHRVLCN